MYRNLSHALLAEMQERLQELHFAARGLDLRAPARRQTMADRVHTIRLLAAELDRLLPTPPA